MGRDSEPEKWICWEHTKVKHEILESYLAPWLTILGKYSPRVCYFDCFAGRGVYQDGSHGSPIIAMRKCDQLLQDGRIRKATCVFIENDEENYTNLTAVIEEYGETHPNMIIWGIAKRSRIVGNKEYTLFLTSLGIASSSTRCVRICLTAENTPQINQIIIMRVIGRIEPTGIIRTGMSVNGNRNSIIGESNGGGGRTSIIRPNRL